MVILTIRPPGGQVPDELPAVVFRYSRKMTRRAYLGDLEEIVLLAVARCEPEAYGMRIRQEIEAQTQRNVAIGAVYASLERLEDKGYIKPSRPPAHALRDPRARRFFTVTPAGVRAAEDTAALRDRLWQGLRLRRDPEGR
jgi:DNA-binding PadR family transcriptional regulator